MSEMYPGNAYVHPWGTKPSCPFLPQYSHVTLSGIDAIVQRLNGHPAHREAALGESGFEGLGKEKGPYSR